MSWTPEMPVDVEILTRLRAVASGATELREEVCAASLLSVLSYYMILQCVHKAGASAESLLGVYLSLKKCAGSMA